MNDDPPSDSRSAARGEGPPRRRPQRTEPLAAAHTDPNTLQLHFAAAIDVGQIGIWRHDLRTQRMHFNRIGAQAIGAPDGAQSLPWGEVVERIHPDDRHRVGLKALLSLQDDTPDDFEIRLRNPLTGRWRHVRSRRLLQRDLRGRPLALHGVSVDVTGPREEARRSSESLRRLELVGQAAGMGHWLTRRGRGEPFWGPMLYTMHGLDPNASPPGLRRWLRHHVHPDDRATVQRSILSWLRQRAPVHEIGFRLLRPDGSTLDVIAHSRLELDGAQPRPFGLLVDVSERRATQQALRRSAERSQLIAHTLGLGTWEHDLLTDAVTWDDQMWRLRGREPGSTPPSPELHRTLVHPADVALIDARTVRGRDHVEPQEYEYRVVWPDGEVHWLSSRSITECDAAGRPLRRIGLNWDITEARALRQAAEERAAAQRELKAKSQFLSRMSHELRTPLNAVLGFAQLLLADEARGDGAQRVPRLQQIQSAGQHLLALIDDVLDLSRLEGGEMEVSLEAVPLAPLLASTLNLVEGLAREHGVSVQVGRLAERAMADPVRLRQVLVNLLSNAIKYNRPGGHVRVQTESADGVTVLQVIDDGPGMAPEQLRHLFEPFNRLGAERGTVPGTGIGLAIVKTLVERMDGTVHVQSRLGEGSCFELRLRDGHGLTVPPSTPAHTHLMALAALSVGRALRGRILYVEDNPINAMILEQLVAHRRGLSLRTAENGLEGLQMASRWQPDLVLLDMQLPDIDGMEIFRRLRADPRCADTPCIALSANALSTDIQAALNAGFVDYWTKPLDFTLFHRAVDTMFGPAPADPAPQPAPDQAAPDQAAPLDTSSATSPR